MAEETVNHPRHYNAHPSGVECITIVEHMDFCVGNAIKYLWRADHKNGLEDLRKALWYINREIERREKQEGGGQPLMLRFVTITDIGGRDHTVNAAEIIRLAPVERIGGSFTPGCLVLLRDGGRIEVYDAEAHRLTLTLITEHEGEARTERQWGSVCPQCGKQVGP